MKWPAYPEYKDSGIEWLDEIPSSWNVAEIKHTHQVTLGKMLQSEASSPADELRPYLRAAHIPPTGLTLDDPKEMWFTPTEIAELTLKKGDVVVVEGGMGGYGRCDMVPEDLPGWGFQNSINRLRPRGGNSGAFTKYLLQIAREKGFLDVLCSVSTMPHLTAEKLAAIRLPMPTPDEQSAIADFLDRETAKIDALIDKQNQLITTLHEDRTAAINHAVIRGIDGSAELKDSGMEWLGQVPAHWVIRPVSSGAILIQTGPFGSQLQASEYIDDGVPVINPSHIVEGRIFPEPKQSVSLDKAKALSRHRLQHDDIIVARRGELGRSAVVDFTAVGYLCGTGSLIIRLDSGVFLPHYFQYFFSSKANRDRLAQISAGSTMDNLNADMVSRLIACIPPLAEQSQIASFLDRHCERIQRLIDKSTQVIETLCEYRSALVTAAVTGKIDVHEAA